jgi:hypothetical protein
MHSGCNNVLFSHLKICGFNCPKSLPHLLSGGEQDIYVLVSTFQKRLDFDCLLLLWQWCDIMR